MTVKAIISASGTEASADIQPKLVSVEKAQSLLGGIGKTRLYEYFYSGELTRVKVGSRTCITVESINRLIDALIRAAI